VKNVLDLENCEITVNEENIVLVILYEFLVLRLIDNSVEFSELEFLILECLLVIFFFESFENLLQKWGNELLQLFGDGEFRDDFLLDEVRWLVICRLG